MPREPERGRRRESDDEPPSTYPVTPPASYHYPHADLILQGVMELQKSAGELRAKVDRLVADVEALEGKLDSHGEKIEAMRRRFALVGGIIAAILLLATFMGPPLGTALVDRLLGREAAPHSSERGQVPLAPPR